ncbi:hypothetical protein SAMCCGM7_pB0436 (plasmid) [Sinorhizobium americanum CCGM7]|nr:hypothetical protein SAMCCGM7_pB0436 [Sinorhizobium americanum CCGM7]
MVFTRDWARSARTLSRPKKHVLDHLALGATAANAPDFARDRLQLSRAICVIFLRKSKAARQIGGTIGPAASAPGSIKPVNAATRQNGADACFRGRARHFFVVVAHRTAR